MKKRVLVIVVFLLVIVLIPFTVLVAKNLIMYTNEGKPIVHSGDEVPKEIQGQEFSLAVPANTTGTTEEMLQKEKDNSLNQTSTENTATLSVEESNAISEEINASMNKDETTETENNFIVVFKKYYGNNETETLFNAIRNETEANSKYIFPENGKTLLRAVLDIIDNSNPTQEEIEILKKVVQSMDLTTLNDDELAQRINNL